MKVVTIKELIKDLKKKQTLNPMHILWKDDKEFFPAMGKNRKIWKYACYKICK